MIPREQHLEDEEERLARAAEPYERYDVEDRGGRRSGDERPPTPWYARRERKPRPAPQRFPTRAA